MKLWKCSIEALWKLVDICSNIIYLMSCCSDNSSISIMGKKTHKKTHKKKRDLMLLYPYLFP